jgi:hypothetical protein
MATRREKKTQPKPKTKNHKSNLLCPHHCFDDYCQDYEFYEFWGAICPLRHPKWTEQLPVRCAEQIFLKSGACKGFFTGDCKLRAALCRYAHPQNEEQSRRWAPKPKPKTETKKDKSLDPNVNPFACLADLKDSA